MTKRLKVTINLSDKKYGSKPISSEIKEIHSNIYKSETSLTAEELAYHISVEGRTTILATYKRTDIYKERLSNLNFKQQQVIMLDFDNDKESIEKNGEFTVKDALKDSFIQENASFLYRTFSDKDSTVDKFRVVFILDKQITDFLDIQNIYNKLLNMYRQADIKCKNHNRLFFGGNQGYKEINFNNTLNTSAFLSDFLTFEVKESKDTKKLEVVEFIKERKTLKVVTNVNTNEKVYELLKTRKMEDKAKAKELILQKFGKEIQRVFESRAQAMTVFRHSIDIRTFLDLPEGNPFNDILEVDENASCGIHTHKNVQFYKRFNKEKQDYLDIIRLLAHLTAQEVKNEKRVILEDGLDLLLYLTNSRIDKTSNISTKVEEIREVIQILRRETFNLEYPFSSKILGKDIIAITQILEIMLEHSFEDFESGEIRQLLFLNVENLTRILNHRLEKNYNEFKVQQILNKSVLMHFISKLDEEEVPKFLYEKYTEKSKNENKMTVNFFEAVTDKTQDFRESFSKELVDKKFTLNSLNFEGLLRLLNEEEAKRVYNNRKETVIKRKIHVDSENGLLSTAKQEQEKILARRMLKVISKDGYCTEEEIVKYVTRYFKEQFFSLSNSKKIMKQLRSGICDSYNLKIIKATKENKKKYGLDEDLHQSTFIYVQA